MQQIDKEFCHIYILNFLILVSPIIGAFSQIWIVELEPNKDTDIYIYSNKFQLLAYLTNRSSHK